MEKTINRRRKRVEDDAQRRQPVEHHEQLHQQRRTAHDPHIKPHNLPQNRHAGILNHGGNDGNYHRDGKGDNRQRNGHFQTGQQNLRERFYQQFDNAFTHGLLKVPSIPNRRQRQSRFLAQK